MISIDHPSRWQHLWWQLGTMLKSVLLIGAAIVALFLTWVLLCGLWSLIH